MASYLSNVDDTASGSSDPLSALHQLTELVKDLQKLISYNGFLVASFGHNPEGSFRVQGAVDPLDAWSRVRKVGFSIQNIISEFPNYIRAGKHQYFLENLRPTLVDLRRHLVDIMPCEGPHIVLCTPVDLNCNDPTTALDHQKTYGVHQLLRHQGTSISEVMGAEYRAQFPGSNMQPTNVNLPWWATDLKTLICFGRETNSIVSMTIEFAKSIQDAFKMDSDEVYYPPSKRQKTNH